MDYTVYQLLWLFLFYSFLGWLAETVLAALKRRRLLNRGFLSAPFSPTYGLGALLFAIFLHSRIFSAIPDQTKRQRDIVLCRYHMKPFL